MFDNRIPDAGSLGRARKLSISIGGIRCSIMGQDAHLLDLLQTRYQWFESSGPAAYEILIQLVPLSELAFNDMEKAPPPVVKRVNSGENYIIKRADNPFVAIVNTSSKKALVKMWNSDHCFDGFLCVFYTLILAETGGLLLHAASIRDGGRGKVFFGSSDSDKTTLAQLSQGGTILTDELALIRLQYGRYQFYGTPWGEFTPGQSNARAELSGLYSLKEDQENGMLPLDKVRAAMDLYRCALFFSDDSSLLRLIFNTCCALVDMVPIYELHFQPDSHFRAGGQLTKSGK